MSLPPFATYGIEIEYMIVDSGSFEILPVADRLLAHLRGGIPGNEARIGPLCWSNELALHVIEVKAADPVTDLLGLAPSFQAQVRSVNECLREHGACLMPTAMHPWMNPVLESHLWPHEDHEIYEAFDRLFDCRGHGWTNLQSSHLNLPFEGEAAFLSLYHACRVILPLLPALAASSPLMDGAPTGRLDNRLHVYQGNCARFPTITGQVIPEPVTSITQYRHQVLNSMYDEVARVDLGGELQHEWLNARGVIARFERNTLEIRVFDCQEHPSVDVALQSVAETLVRYLMATCSVTQLAAVPQEFLVGLFRRGVESAGNAILDGNELSAVLALPRANLTLRQIWEHLSAGPALAELPAQARGHLEAILESGCLGERILQALDGNYSRGAMVAVYRRLAQSLDSGQMFRS
jgi:carboxylate-amine ligase